MKKHLIIIILLGISVSLYAQKNSEIEITKMSNVIELTTNYQSIDDAFTGVYKTFLNSGIGVMNANKEIGCLNTAVYSHRQVNNQLTVIFMIRGGKIYVDLFGTFLSGLEINLSEVTSVYRGQRGSLARQAWDGMMRVANLIDHTNMGFKDTLSDSN